MRHERNRLADGKISEDEYINFLTTAGGALEMWSGTDQRHWQDIAKIDLERRLKQRESEGAAPLTLDEQ